MTEPFVLTAWMVTAALDVSTLFRQSFSVPLTRCVPTGKFAAMAKLAAFIAAKTAAKTPDLPIFFMSLFMLLSIFC